MDEMCEPMDVEIIPVTDDAKNVDSEQIDVKTFNSNDVQQSEIQLDSRYENRGGTFMTGIDIFSKEEKLKMEERAKRFGLTDKIKYNLPNQEQDLYSSMGIVEDSENTKNIRLNVIHMRGTEEMSTKDVFKYFEDYAPASIEWINDISCNVVWLDNLSAARAILGLSKRIIGLEKQQITKSLDGNPDEENNVTNDDSMIEMDEDNEIANTTKEIGEDYISIKDINYPLPPGLWRKGIDYPKSKAIFLRFATRADKKQPKAEKMSEYYKKYGNPNFGGIKGILTESRKRMYKQIRQNKRKFKEEPQDDVQDRRRVKNPWGALSESWGLNDTIESEFGSRNESKDQGRSVKERLGVKYPPKETTHVEEQRSNSSSDSEDEWCKRSKVLRMRMHADDEEEKIHKRRAKLRQTMLNNLTKSNDLRSRLSAPRKGTQFRDAIQVVVTNTTATKSNSLKLNDSEEEDGEIIEDNESQENEEGEWQGSDEEKQEEEDEDENYSAEDSDKPAKEVQGPKGSVIKVVQHKPRVASTVWARLNNVKSEIVDNSIKDRQPRIQDLRNTLRGDLRSRIRNHTRGRSPLRIEVKNDKYTEGSETE
ncbi:nuclear cap-binding protein subunit 3-like isoform X1 [Bombus pascuorum]|uniref:nuclear cap-binding protein subunit 3-like isoform X1 n=2 Tax=Bombus pascuorum TaxID=65598 RepID=UPI00212EB396|nr:nuclear cap-binding protein subunit 3-like isoform X1 [Bombus pascuorum]